MDKEYTNGRTVESMLEIINMIKKVVMVNIIGMMDVFFRVYGRAEKEMGKAECCMLMEQLRKDTGRMTKESN